MVDESRKAAVRVVLELLRGALLALAQVQVDELVLESELFKNDDRLPVVSCEWRPR